MVCVGRGGWDARHTFCLRLGGPIVGAHRGDAEDVGVFCPVYLLPPPIHRGLSLREAGDICRALARGLVIFAVRSLVDFLDNLPFAFPPHHLGARSFLNHFTAIVCFVEADIVPCARVRIL